MPDILNSFLTISSQLYAFLSGINFAGIKLVDMLVAYAVISCFLTFVLGAIRSEDHPSLIQSRRERRR